MRELLWRGVARIVTIPAVTDWLIARAQCTPYHHITGKDGSRYMGRWWLLNPYPAECDGGGDRKGWRAKLPSIRIHQILRPDGDRHPHDHPWNARTIVLRNGYEEERPTSYRDRARTVYWRGRGYTGRLLFKKYHRISYVPPDGVWTLFITWRKQGTWGFLVDGAKVPWRKYLGIDKPATVEHHPV